MFASPNRVPKCPWLRNRLYQLNSSMGGLGGGEGIAERGASVPSFAIPAPAQGGQ